MIDRINESLNVDSNSTKSAEVIALDEAGNLVETLSCEKRRAILTHLSEEPTNPAGLAEQLGTSVQNVLYHIEKLQTAGLVQVAGTHYSPKGREMNVYTSARPAIVIDIPRTDSKTQDGTSEAVRRSRWPAETERPAKSSDE